MNDLDLDKYCPMVDEVELSVFYFTEAEKNKIKKFEAELDRRDR